MLNLFFKKKKKKLSSGLAFTKCDTGVTLKTRVFICDTGVTLKTCVFIC